MKDKQVPSASAEPRIFIVSALLHCVSMTVLVYLRRSFGFGYLRPRSVFFAFSWAFLLYAVYSWIDGSEWSHRRAVLLFGSGAVLLYWTHFFIAFGKEWQQTGEHERYSGTSHLLLLAHKGGAGSFSQSESKLLLWAEPGLIFLLAATLRVAVNESILSAWLSLTAVSLFTKEALNWWYHIRQRKGREDMFDDTEESVETPVLTNMNTERLKATRKEKISRPRMRTVNDEDAS